MSNEEHSADQATALPESSTEDVTSSLDIHEAEAEDQDGEEVSTESVLSDKDTPAPNNGTTAGVEDNDDDDDFGDFSDASFDDFEEPQAAPGQSPAEEQLQESALTSHHSSFPQSTFHDQNSLNAKLEALCREAFPHDLETVDISSEASLLNERSTHLLERLIAKPYLKPYNWKRGSLRRQLLVTLGLPDNPIVHKERSSQFDMESYVVRKLSELGIDGDERSTIILGTEDKLERLHKSVLSEELLTEMKEDQLADAIATLTRDVEQAERLLSVWEDEKVKLEEDHRTYESVVENLVGHTQRLRREEALKSLKKEKEKGKLGLFKKKLKK